MIPFQARLCLGMTPEIYITNPESRAFQQRIKSPKDLVRDMLADEKLSHSC